MLLREHVTGAHCEDEAVRATQRRVGDAYRAAGTPRKRHQLAAQPQGTAPGRWGAGVTRRGHRRRHRLASPLWQSAGAVRGPGANRLHLRFWCGIGVGIRAPAASPTLIRSRSLLAVVIVTKSMLLALPTRSWKRARASGAVQAPARRSPELGFLAGAKLAIFGEGED